MDTKPIRVLGTFISYTEEEKKIKLGIKIEKTEDQPLYMELSVPHII